MSIPDVWNIRKPTAVGYSLILSKKELDLLINTIDGYIDDNIDYYEENEDTFDELNSIRNKLSKLRRRW